MLRYFQIKLFPNITTLFYLSQLHVPLYNRNTGWGSRYHGLGILTPAQFDNFEIRNVVICQRRTQIILGDIYSSIVFSITTFILSVTVTYCTVCQENRVGVKIPWPGHLDPHPVFLTHCVISYQDRLENANI